VSGSTSTKTGVAPASIMISSQCRSISWGFFTALSAVINAIILKRSTWGNIINDFTNGTCELFNINKFPETFFITEDELTSLREEALKKRNQEIQQVEKVFNDNVAKDLVIESDKLQAVSNIIESQQMVIEKVPQNSQSIENSKKIIENNNKVKINLVRSWNAQLTANNRNYGAMWLTFFNQVAPLEQAFKTALNIYDTKSHFADTISIVLTNLQNENDKDLVGFYNTINSCFLEAKEVFEKNKSQIPDIYYYADIKLIFQVADAILTAFRNLDPSINIPYKWDATAFNKLVQESINKKNEEEEKINKSKSETESISTENETQNIKNTNIQRRKNGLLAKIKQTIGSSVFSDIERQLSGIKNLDLYMEELIKDPRWKNNGKIVLDNALSLYEQEKAKDEATEIAKIYYPS